VHKLTDGGDENDERQNDRTTFFHDDLLNNNILDLSQTASDYANTEKKGKNLYKKTFVYHSLYIGIYFYQIYH